MNLGYILSRLRNRLNDDTDSIDGEYKDSELTLYVNQALAWFCRILKDKRSTTYNSISGVSTNSEVIGNAKFTLPTNAFDVETLIVDWYEGSGESLSQVHKVLKRRDMSDIIDTYPDEGVNDYPRYYYIDNKEVIIYPIETNQIYNYVVRTYDIQQVKNLNDNIYFSEEFEAPLLDACEYFVRRTRPTVEANLNICQMLYGNIVNFFNERGKVVPQQAGVQS